MPKIMDEKQLDKLSEDNILTASVIEASQMLNEIVEELKGKFKLPFMTERAPKPKMPYEPTPQEPINMPDYTKEEM